MISTEAYSDISHTSKIEFFAKIVNNNLCSFNALRNILLQDGCYKIGRGT